MIISDFHIKGGGRGKVGAWHERKQGRVKLELHYFSAASADFKIWAYQTTRFWILEIPKNSGKIPSIVCCHLHFISFSPSMKLSLAYKKNHHEKLHKFRHRKYLII